MPPRTTVTANEFATWASRSEAQELLPILPDALISVTKNGLQQVGLQAYGLPHHWLHDGRHH